MAFSKLVASSRTQMPTQTLWFQILNPCHAILWFCESWPSWTPGLLLSEEREQILRQDFHTRGSELETCYSGQRQSRSVLTRLCLFRLVWGQSFRAGPPNQNRCVLPTMLTMVMFIKWKEPAKAARKPSRHGLSFIHFSVPSSCLNGPAIGHSAVGATYHVDIWGHLNIANIK